VAVVVGEGELGAGVGALAPDDHARALRPAREVEPLGDLGDLAVGPLRAVLTQRRAPGALGQRLDRLTDRLGQVEADREADPSLARPVEQLVGGAGRIDAQQDVDRLDAIGRDLPQRRFGDGDLVGCGVGAGVARAQQPGGGLGGLIDVGQQRVKAEARPSCRGRADGWGVTASPASIACRRYR